MTKFSVRAVSTLKDNYVWLIHAENSAHVIVIDPGDEKPVIQAIQHQELIPVAIIITHHHYDHVDGIEPFLEHFKVPVYGPANESIPAVTNPLLPSDNLSIHRDFPSCQVIAVPGHTNGHLAYLFDDSLFCGDTLFSAGCGRLLGGTYSQLLNSLKYICSLPLKTKIYCAHEYTVNNLRFSLVVEPGNHEVQQRLEYVEKLRTESKITLPSTLEIELATNPFLRCQEPSVVSAAEQYISHSLVNELAVFTVLRQWKDNF
jgi:hydroxyacylglutathione hydrolase